MYHERERGNGLSYQKATCHTKKRRDPSCIFMIEKNSPFSKDYNLSLFLSRISPPPFPSCFDGLNESFRRETPVSLGTTSLRLDGGWEEHL